MCIYERQPVSEDSGAPMKKRRYPPLLKTFQVCWAYSNCGVLWGTARTRSEAIEAAEKETGEPWKVIQDRIEVRRVRVVPLDQR